MSGNKIGFNEITEIGLNGNYGADLNSRLKAINDNFQKIANADYMKGVDGDDVRVLNASFAVGVDGDTNPLGERNLYYNNGEKITKGTLYTSIRNCIKMLTGNDNEATPEKASINGISWDSGLLENNSIMIIADEENGNYYLKSSLYFVYNDPRFANPTESAAYGNLKNLSCVVTYDGENWVASQPFPKIYYSADVNDFCWEINGQRTKLIARGPQGLSGQNYPVWLCYSNPDNITEISTTDDNKTISITIDGIYRFDGTSYNYITPENEFKDKWTEIISKEEFKNNMALCIVHTKNAENNPIIKLYCGYLYNQSNVLYIYTTPNSAIDTIIGHESLYSLLKSNSPGDTIQNSLFIPTSSVNADGSLSGKQIYSIYGQNETVSNQPYHTFNIGVSTVNNNQTLSWKYSRTKLNLWGGEINFFTHIGENDVKKNALQITPGIINIHGNLISDHNNNGIPHRYIQMKLPESYLTFESYTQRNLSDSLSPIDTAMNPEACANRLSFYNPDLVDIEYLKYSTDEDTGETISTWEDCFVDEDPDVAYKIKTKLLTTGFKDTLSNLHLGRKFNTNGNFTNKDKLRVSIYIKPGEFYGRIDKLNLYTAFRPATTGNLKMNCKIYLYKITNNIRINREEFDKDIKKYYNGEKTWEGLDATGQQTITIENPWAITTKDGTDPTGEPTYTHENLSGEPGWASIALHDSNMIGSYNNANYPNHYNFTVNRTYKIVLEFGLEGPDAYQNESGTWVNTSLVARVGGIRLFGSKWYAVKDKNGNTNSLAGYNSICSWDENGTVLFPAGISNQQFKITYNKLKDLADNGKLIPGTKYRITDYKPKFNDTDIKSGNHQFDIIVEAVDNKTLSENADAVLHNGDTYFENSKLNKWELKYSLNTSGFDWVTANDPGVIYYMKDEFDNEAHYDFKNVIYVSNISNDPNEPSYATARNYIINLLIYYRIADIIKNYLVNHSDQFNNPDDPTYLQNLINWIQNGAQIIYTYNCSCSFYTFSSIYIDNLNITSASSSLINCTFDVKTKDYSFAGIGYCEDNVLGRNSLYNIFIAANEAAIEQSGISYITKNNKLDINCRNNIFGENCRNNIFGENCVGNNLMSHCENNYFEKFCSRNNCNEYFKENKLGEHTSDNVFGKNYVHNIIKSHLIQSTFGNNCSNNMFGTEVSIENSRDNNTVYDYKSIKFGNNCSYNNLGQGCYDIDFKNECSYNNLGQGCYDIDFKNECSYNNLGQGCRHILFISSCRYNNLGSNNNNIKTSFQSMISDCTIGNSCSNILFISPLTCAKGTQENSYIYSPIPMSIEGAKIGDNCNGFIISISKKITGGHTDYKNKYASFLLYSTDIDDDYTPDYRENILKPHRIFETIPAVDGTWSAGDFIIKGLNIYNNTDKTKIYPHGEEIPKLSEYIIPVKVNNLSSDPEKWNMDDLCDIFVNDYMIELTSEIVKEHSFVVLSCRQLMLDKSVAEFHMQGTGIETRYKMISPNWNGERPVSCKKQTIAVEWK